MIFLALAVLTRWSELAYNGPVTPDISVRFALAFLFNCGRSGERRIYNEFWKLLSDPGHAGKHVGQNNYVRKSYCDSCIKGIISDVGASHTPQYAEALRAAASKIAAGKTVSAD